MRTPAAVGHGEVCDLVGVAVLVAGGIRLGMKPPIDMSKRYWEDLWRPGRGGIKNLVYKYRRSSVPS